MKVNLQDGKENGALNPSIEWQMHVSTYIILQCVNHIIHTPSAYTLGVVTSHALQHVIKEANIVVRNPVVIDNNPSRSIELAEAVSELFGDEVRAIIFRNHGVVSAGKDCYRIA